MDRKDKNHKFKRNTNKKNNQKSKKNDEKLVFAKQLTKTKIEEKEIEELKKLYLTADSENVKNFGDFPLSKYSKNGIFDAKYLEPTEIQKEVIIPALKGEDILGAAKTGSGKTLAFIIPLLECLYRERWTRIDSLGALIITPTRELAYQIFEVINKVGCYHDFSVSLIIGGFNLKFESKRISGCNIIICTPGRLLQHMDENPSFTCENLRFLVLDEADRILDMGFSQTIDAIIDNLPPADQRQTLLFSATQTKSVKDLARLSLKNPIYISVDEKADNITPDKLVQSYIICNLEDKLNILFSFIKNHKNQKILIFLSSCHQVKFIYNLFSHLKPGISLLALYGTLHQIKRMEVYNRFKSKEHCVLFATDIASRGLDFPSVNWVVQADCPEDANTYVHRAGRTARYKDKGESLLLLQENEQEEMIELLTSKKIPIEQITIDSRKLMSIQRKAEAFCASRVDIKESAERAFKSFVKNYFFMKNKKIFNLDNLNLDKYAHSLGLVVTPRLRFIEKAKLLQKKQKTSNEKKLAMKKDEKSSGDEEVEKDEKIKTNDEMFHYGEDNSSDDDDLLTVKRIHNFDEDDLNINKKDDEIDDENDDTNIINKNNRSKKVITKASIAKKLSKKKINVNQKLLFDDEGNPIEDFPRAQKSEILKIVDEKNPSGIDIDLAKKIMEDEDKIDKKLQRQIIKLKHLEKKKKLKEKLNKDKEDKKNKNNVTLKVKKNLVEDQDEDEDEEVDAEDAEEDYEDQSDEHDDSLSKLIDELPDPDRIYGKKRDSDVSGSDDDDDDYDDDGNSEQSEDDQNSDNVEQLSDDEFESEYRKTKKRKLNENNLINDESLALQLLNSKY